MINTEIASFDDGGSKAGALISHCFEDLIQTTLVFKVVDGPTTHVFQGTRFRSDVMSGAPIRMSIIWRSPLWRYVRTLCPRGRICRIRSRATPPTWFWCVDGSVVKSEWQGDTFLRALRSDRGLSPTSRRIAQQVSVCASSPPSWAPWLPMRGSMPYN